MAAVQAMHSSGSSTRLQAPSSTAPVFEFVCLFTPDLRRKQKRWQDGRIKYHTFNKRVMVYDERGNFVGDTHWREDYDFDDGEELELERGGVIVQVAECTGSRDQDLSELIDKRAQEKAQRQSAAVARRPPTLDPSTPRAVAPHFQLRHTPLHSVIGTPTGHHGRALVPTESPYEERQRQAASTGDPSARPAKRRKRDVSPPSKSGYAQSLFGAALSLSGRPMSSAPIRQQPSKTSRFLDDTSLPASSDRSNQESEGDPLSQKTQAAGLNLQAKAPTVVARSLLLKSLPRHPPTASSRIVAEPEPPSSFGNEIEPQGQATPTVRDRQSILNRNRGKSSLLAFQALQPISTNANLRDPNASKHATAKDKTKRPLLDDTSSAKVSRRKDTQGQPALVRHKTTDQEQKALDLPNLLVRPTETVDLTEEHDESPIAEARTELRIKPRKKRGLLMVSEKVVERGSSTKTKQNKSRTSRTSPSTSFGESTFDGSKAAAFGSNAPKDTGVLGDDDLLQKGQKSGQPSGEIEDASYGDTNTRLTLSTGIDGLDDIQRGLLETEKFTKERSKPEASNSKNRAKKKATRHSAHDNHDATAAILARVSLATEDDIQKQPDLISVQEHNSPAPSWDDPFKEMEEPRGRARGKEREDAAAISPEDQGDLQENTRPSRKCKERRLRRNKDKETADIAETLDATTGNQDDEGPSMSPQDGLALPNGIPPPRLAQLGRKSIRSKEVIGFIFDEEPETRKIIPRDGSNGHRASFQLPQSQVVREKPIPTAVPDQRNARRTESETLESLQPNVQALTTNSTMATTNDTGEGISGGASTTEKATPAPQDRTALPLPPREENTASESNAGVAAQPTATGDTPEVMPNLQRMSKRVNPASRGKKAAKPSDAAGKVPVCPLPSDTGPALPLNPGTRQNPRKKQAQEIQNKGAQAPVPGFSRANGGPWSREAHDLFEFTRPP